MAAPSPKSVRKPHRQGGMQVRICGRTIQKKGNIVCTLPPSRHLTHSAVAMSDDDERVYAFLKTNNGDIQVWQLVGPPE